MKKIYETPKMEVEEICVEMPIAMSYKINSEEGDPTATAEDVLGKDRDNSDWGGLW